MISGTKTPLDVVVPCHSKDKDTLQYCLAGCRKNIVDAGNIYVISDMADVNIAGVRVIQEDELFDDGLSKQYIRRRWLTEYGPNAHRAGWLYQQFIKMGCCYAIKDISEYYLLLDSDAVFLKKTHFIRDGKMLLTKADEHHQPYFDCYKRLFGESAGWQYSFVSHHMLICKSIMLEMLRTIETRFGKKWYDAVLDAIDYSQSACFSEYETYGHYLKRFHPNAIRVCRLVNVHKFNRRNYLKILFGLADYVSVHDYKKPENNPKTNPVLFYKCIRLLGRRLLLQTVI